MDSMNAVSVKRLNICFVVFLVMFNSVTGSCLSYGHSCWGAHGKRNGNPTNTNLIDQKSIQWFLSKLDASQQKADDLITADDLHSAWKAKILRNGNARNEFDESIPGVIIPEPTLIKDLLTDTDDITIQKFDDKPGAATPIEDLALVDRLRKRQASTRGRKLNWQILRNNGEPIITTLNENDFRNYI